MTGPSQAPPCTPESARAGVAAGFRTVREAAGLSQRDLASALGTSVAAIRDLEANDDELFTAYSVTEVQLIAAALGTNAATLLHCQNREPPVRTHELIERIRSWRRNSPGSLAALESQAGWRIDPLLESPDRLLSDLTVAALERLCTVLERDWRQVIAGLPDS